MSLNSYKSYIKSYVTSVLLSPIYMYFKVHVGKSIFFTSFT